MPPHTLSPAAVSRYLYLVTALIVSSVVVWVGFAGAGPPDPQCRGNSPRKICPKLTPSSGDTVSDKVTVVAEVPEAVIAVEFKINDGPLAPEDVEAPFETAWDTTKWPDGKYTLSATARDLNGNTSTRENLVTVSNAPPDASAPSVDLTSPAAGATVSSSIAVAANASDNVGVVGVQFKVNGTNLGSEDTTAPYSVSWDTTKTSNGSHTLSAVARDAAGNTASSQRTVTVSNTSSSSGTKLTWAPPALTSPITIEVTNANKQLNLDKSRDYVLKIKEKLVGRPGLWIEGGRNVVVVGGHIEMNSEGTSSYWDRTAVKVRYSTGVVHLEGLLINGAYLADGIVTAAPAATLQIQNVRVENAHATGSEHPDCLQTQAGLGALRIDRFSCSTQLQGIFLQAASSDLKVGPSDIRNTNIEGAGGKYLFWQETASVGPISLSNVWIKGNDPKWADFGMWVWPNKNAEGQSDPTRRAIVSSDGSYLTFQSSNISGRIYKGAPSGGDFVPRSLVGPGYVSPGYS